MYEGFEMRRNYEERLHFETLDLLRYVAYTVYCSIPTKKGAIKAKTPEKFLPLRFDKKQEITKEDIKKYSNMREPYITKNGKLKGYIDTEGKVWNKKTEDGIIIGYMINGKITLNG